MFGGTVEHFRSSGIHGMSHPYDLNALAGCLFSRMDTAGLPLWGTCHVANTVVIFVYYS